MIISSNFRRIVLAIAGVGFGLGLAFLAPHFLRVRAQPGRLALTQTIRLSA